MNLLGLHLQLLIGQTVPTPPPLKISEALESVEVTTKDEGRSGFQLVFQVGRSVLDLKDYALLKEDRIKPFNRVVLSVLFGVRPLPIMDGIITNHQLAPGNDPGTSKLTITGEDVSLMIDLEQKAQAYPQLSVKQTVELIIATQLTTQYGVLPDVSPVENVPVLTADEQTPTQDRKTTHLGYIKKLADRFGYVFYVEPGAVPLTNVFYFGPPVRGDTPQGALAVNMGPNTNVETISFKYNELSPKRVSFDRESDTPEQIDRPNREPALAARIPDARKLEFMDLQGDAAARRAQAQGAVNKSFDQVVTATGTLDALRYGRILKPRGKVDLRGAGDHYDGTYYVKSVTHKIDVRKGEYKQAFVLNREGVGTTTPFVSP